MADAFLQILILALLGSITLLVFVSALCVIWFAYHIMKSNDDDQR